MTSSPLSEGPSPEALPDDLEATLALCASGMVTSIWNCEDGMDACVVWAHEHLRVLAREILQVEHHRAIRAHFDAPPLLIKVPGHAGVAEYNHAACSAECVGVLTANPDFSCFHDGCQMECCGCGRCCSPAKCDDTGKGHSWHE